MKYFPHQISLQKQINRKYAKLNKNANEMHSMCNRLVSTLTVCEGFELTLLADKIKIKITFSNQGKGRIGKKNCKLLISK